MRLLVTVDPEIPVPPQFYGGVERLVEGLLEWYKDQGHEVALLANRESSSHFPHFFYPWPASHSRGSKNVWKNAWRLKRIIDEFQPEVVHSFSRLLYMYPSFLFNKTPFLQTYGRFISKRSTLLASLVGGRKLQFTCCGKHMLRNELSFKKRFTCVYNFAPLDRFQLKTSPGEYLLYLGRIEDIKGTKEAIEVAQKSGEKLVIAGNVQPGHNAYFQTYIEPKIDGEHVVYTGPVNDAQKNALFQKAKAFLFPIKWEEPFGMVMVEAMAAGIPVLGFKRGAVPEVVIHGKNGWVGQNVEDLVQGVKKIKNLEWSAEEIRNYMISNFTLSTIGPQYLELLNNLRQTNGGD